MLKALSRFSNKTICLSRDKKVQSRIMPLITRSMFTNMDKTKELELLNDMYPTVMEALMKEDNLKASLDFKECLENMISTNLEGGKKIRSLTVIHVFKTLANPEDVNEENLRLARIMGWCLEMLHSVLLIVDDMLDNSLIRRGKPCWYRRPEVGMKAVNDILLLKCAYSVVLRTFFKEKPYYLNLVEAMEKALFLTSYGQYLDYMITTSVNPEKKDYSHFTIDRYKIYSIYKTAYITCVQPVALGLYLADITDKQTHKQIEDITKHLGYCFQVKDDYLDTWGEREKTGQEGNDIIESKFTFQAVTTLQKCTSNQLKVFNVCYGSKEPAHYERILRLYEELNIKQIQLDYETREYEKIKRKIHNLPQSLNRHATILMDLSNSLYKRTS